MPVRRRSTLARVSLFSIAITLAACGAASEEPDPSTLTDHLEETPAFDVDRSQTSASGLSSGAFMAVQFHVAFSSMMRGVAVFAGGPFGCSQGSALRAATRCMTSSWPLDPSPSVATTRGYAAAGAIDPLTNLKGQRVFLFGGANDTTVNPAVMDGLHAYYATVGVQPEDIAFERRRAGTGHTMPTLDSGGDCAASTAPYVGSCGYDGAGEALAQIYGPLQPRDASAPGTFIAIPQGDFIDSPRRYSLADTAWAYVPRSCSRGETCRVHVAFHGCLQSTSKVGDAFYKHAGYNEWAENNHLIVLYPQTITSPMTNPNGCWDWWGYAGADFAKRTGPQMKMVKSMIDRLSGAVPAPPAADAGAPADAGTTDVTPPLEAPTCAFTSNTEHVAAGRALASFGFAFARGSGQPLGLANAYVRTSLVRVAKDVYVIGPCL